MDILAGKPCIPRKTAQCLGTRIHERYLSTTSRETRAFKASFDIEIFLRKSSIFPQNSPMFEKMNTQMIQVRQRETRIQRKPWCRDVLAIEPYIPANSPAFSHMNHAHATHTHTLQTHTHTHTHASPIFPPKDGERERHTHTRTRGIYFRQNTEKERETHTHTHTRALYFSK